MNSEEATSSYFDPRYEFECPQWADIAKAEEEPRTNVEFGDDNEDFWFSFQHFHHEENCLESPKNKKKRRETWAKRESLKSKVFPLPNENEELHGARRKFTRDKRVKKNNDVSPRWKPGVTKPDQKRPNEAENMKEKEMEAKQKKLKERPVERNEPMREELPRNQNEKKTTKSREHEVEVGQKELPKAVQPQHQSKQEGAATITKVPRKNRDHSNLKEPLKEHPKNQKAAEEAHKKDKIRSKSLFSKADKVLKGKENKPKQAPHKVTFTYEPPRHGTRIIREVDPSLLQLISPKLSFVMISGLFSFSFVCVSPFECRF